MLRSKNEQDKLLNQEEQELARALVESLQMTHSNHPFGGESSSSAAFTSQIPASSHSNEDLSPLHLPINLPSDVPAYLPASPSTYPVDSLPQDRLDFLDNPPVYSDRLSSSLAAMESLQRTEADESRLVFDDEAYARQLLAEEEDELSRRIEEKGRLEAERQQRPQQHRLPHHASEGLFESNANQSPQHFQSQPARIMPSVPSQSSSQIPPQAQAPPSFSAMNDKRPPLQTVNSNASTSSTHSVRPEMNHRTHANSMSSVVVGPSNAPQLTRHHSSAGVVSPNQFLDRELLSGVCEYTVSSSSFGLIKLHPGRAVRVIAVCKALRAFGTLFGAGSATMECGPPKLKSKDHSQRWRDDNTERSFRQKKFEDGFVRVLKVVASWLQFPAELSLRDDQKQSMILDPDHPSPHTVALLYLARLLSSYLLEVIHCR